jgi:hypothetical protein
MLNSPEIVAAFAAQLRRSIGSYAEFVAAIRRDAEAMWECNPPEGYGSFEAWWRHRWVRGPLRGIQEHLEEAAKLTHALEARYRRGRHEIPAARQAAAARKQAPALGQASRRTTGGPRPVPPRQADTGAEQGGDFMDLVHRGERSA